MRKRRLVNAALLLYLAVQIWLPARVLWREAYRSSGGAGREYSWGMYARTFGYAVHYRVVHRNGTFTDVRPEEFLSRPSFLHAVLVPDRLERFNVWLCEELRDRGLMRPGDILIGRARLQPRRGDSTTLLEPNVDLCTADRSGVRAS